MKFSSAIICLLLACSLSFADTSDMIFTECKEVSGAAFVVSSLKHDGMSADQIRNEIMDGMDVSKEVKGIYMQQVYICNRSKWRSRLSIWKRTWTSTTNMYTSGVKTS